jgi:catechol 2,3-dioxygenase-like lactoylglutathione lyase family enzyme
MDTDLGNGASFPSAVKLPRASSNFREIEMAIQEPSSPTSAHVEHIDMKLEVVVIPVSDVDRAKSFYTGLGWRLDADVAGNDGFRVVQVTPPGSPCSVIFGSNVSIWLGPPCMNRKITDLSVIGRLSLANAARAWTSPGRVRPPSASPPTFRNPRRDVPPPPISSMPLGPV